MREGKDEDGRLRVVVARPGLSDLLDLAMAQPRRYGAADPAVLASLYGLLRAVAWRARGGTPDEAEACEAIGAQLGRLNATAKAAARAGDHDDTEVATLRALSSEVSQALDGVWRSPQAGSSRLSRAGGDR